MFYILEHVSTYFKMYAILRVQKQKSVYICANRG